ncbi:hypothetical protein O181_083459 [Austropuccinia psidii MF-1]|uniref:Uncharacterized protein n=1 Tax=Austropuccinia psidii MF-1 TaxID=1389203 RepID=A0A9Q3ILU7_9BASI|nr:hypothetical protein [Austropuccinia psidii MF-1]
MASENQCPTTTPIAATSLEDNLHLRIDPLTDFAFFQINCHNLYDSNMSVLNTELTRMALLLQEPWTNPYNWLPPTHQNWHRYTPRTSPNNHNEKPRPDGLGHYPRPTPHYPKNNTPLCLQHPNNFRRSTSPPDLAQ